MSDNPTLESLDTRLQRLIEEWKKAHEKSVVTENHLPDWTLVEDQHTADFLLAQLIALHPELLKTSDTTIPDHYSPNGLEGALIPQLLALPDEIRRLQEAYDESNRQYQTVCSVFSIRALETRQFTGKDGSSHLAANDTERKLAIDDALAEADQSETGRSRADALRSLQQAKNRLECARLIIQLVCKGNKF